MGDIRAGEGGRGYGEFVLYNFRKGIDHNAAMMDQGSFDKKALSERDICTKFITPAIKDVAGWDLMQFSEEFTLGKIFVKGKRVAHGSKDRADYILFHIKNQPLAIIEAKDNNHDIGAGMQQGLRYAEMIDVPFVYSSNGDGFVEHDRTKTEGLLERTLGLNEFPSPQELWERFDYLTERLKSYCSWNTA